MSTKYGWNPNQKVVSWLKARVKEKTGKHDSTFLEVRSPPVVTMVLPFWYPWASAHRGKWGQLTHLEKRLKN